VTVLWAKQSRVPIPVEERDFFFSKMSKVALELSKTPIQTVLGFFLVVMQLARDVEPSPSTSVEVKNEWSFTSTPCSMPSWLRQGHFTFSHSLTMI